MPVVYCMSFFDYMVSCFITAIGVLVAFFSPPAIIAGLFVSFRGELMIYGLGILLALGAIVLGVVIIAYGSYAMLKTAARDGLKDAHKTKKL